MFPESVFLRVKVTTLGCGAVTVSSPRQNKAFLSIACVCLNAEPLSGIQMSYSFRAENKQRSIGENLLLELMNSSMITNYLRRKHWPRRRLRCLIVKQTKKIMMSQPPSIPVDIWEASSESFSLRNNLN